jgi:uncharacterized protein
VIDAGEVLIIVAAIAVGAFVKGVTGSGLPQIAIPVMAGFLGVERAVIIMVIPGLVANGWLLWRYRGSLPEARDLPLLLGTGILGAVGGSLLLTWLDGRVLSGFVAGLILAYIGLRVGRPTFRLEPSLTRALSPPVGFAAGALQGTTGMSGPILTMWLHGYRLPTPVFVVSLVTLFQVFGVAQAATFVSMGVFTPVRALEGTLALLPMALVLPLGARLSQRLAAPQFDRAIMLLLLGSAARLLYAVFE